MNSLPNEQTVHMFFTWFLLFPLSFCIHEPRFQPSIDCNVETGWVVNAILFLAFILIKAEYQTKHNRSLKMQQNHFCTTVVICEQI